VETVKTAECRLEIRTAVWLRAKVRERGLQLQPGLNAGPVCDAQPRWGGIRGLLSYISEPHRFTFSLFLYIWWRFVVVLHLMINNDVQFFQ